jgi:hypothetical protein
MLAQQCEAQQQQAYVFRIGTNSGIASAPTSVLCLSGKPSSIGPVFTEPKTVRQFFEEIKYQQLDGCVILNR